MAFDREYFNLGHLDALSYQDTFVHRLDPRAKIITIIFFIFTVISFPKYEISGLIPLIFFPVTFFMFGDIPVLFIMKKVLIVSPFVILVGIFNPILDKREMYQIFGISLSAGWVSFFSIILKFFLAITSALLLIATTSFPRVCYGLRKLGVPQIFISQMLFLYRYMFVLADETMKIIRGREMRTFEKNKINIKAFAQMISIIFIRTLERAERIYKAMLARGFNGEINIERKYKFNSYDMLFIVFSVLSIYLARRYDLPDIIGRLIMKGIG
ncbi:MAG: cobalt ECF transporter T component CbiQ [Nitrospiraceae bacterium]|nr:cobalt ECF transporter T component CbiQ [Nitrospiraceae bacterium]